MPDRRGLPQVRRRMEQAMLARMAVVDAAKQARLVIAAEGHGRPEMSPVLAQALAPLWDALDSLEAIEAAGEIRRKPAQ